MVLSKCRCFVNNGGGVRQPLATHTLAECSISLIDSIQVHGNDFYIVNNLTINILINIFK
jgi:hypothetical protein